MKKLKFSFIVLSIFILSSCSHRLIDFTIISTKNISLTKGESFVRGENRVKGTDVVHWIIFFSTGEINIKEAVDKAIESTPRCVALLDGVIYTKFWWIPFIYGQEAVIVEGLPLIDPNWILNSEKKLTYGKIELDKNNKIKEVVSLSFSEYITLKNDIVKQSKEVKFENLEEL